LFIFIINSGCEPRASSSEWQITINHLTINNNSKPETKNRKPIPTELQQFYAKNRGAWRKWLEKNHKTSPGIWLLYYKKSTGKPRVEYNDAVEEALCFGWIDSMEKSLDEERFMQRFTPRKPKSGWSKSNKDRVEKLMKEGLMKEAGLNAIRIAQENGSWESLDKIYAPADQLEIPGDLKKAFARNKKAGANFEKFPVFAKRQFLHWINQAKRPETRKNRIRTIVQKSSMNEKPGM